MIILLRKEEGDGNRSQISPIRAPFGKKTILFSGWSGNDVHAREKVRGKERFLKTREDLGFLNLQYRSVLAALFSGVCFRSFSGKTAVRRAFLGIFFTRGVLSS
jgi:hypothetical protein